MALDNLGEANDSKKTSTVPTIVAFLVLSLIGGGAGWWIGGMASANFGGVPKAKKNTASATDAQNSEDDGAQQNEEKGLPHISTEDGSYYVLDPFVSNLAYPANRLIRLEIALKFHGKPNVNMAEAIHSDIMKYLPTISLNQISGPRALEYLKQDLEEIASIRSKGEVSDLLFRMFVVQ